MQSIIFCIALLFCFCHGRECDQPTGSSEETSKNRYYPCGRAAPIEEDCVRNFFVSIDQCTPVSHEDGDPVYIPHMIAYIPTLNVTIDCTKVKATIFGSKILAFYVNQITEKLVFAIDFQGLAMESPKAYMTVARTGQEPLEVEFPLNVTYSATLTAYVPARPGYTPVDVVVSSFNKNPFPPIELGSNITQSKDPLVHRVYQEFKSNLPTATQQLFLTEAYYYFFEYLQKYICDFGYKYSGDVNG